jgi:hypothetical protein
VVRVRIAVNVEQDGCIERARAAIKELSDVPARIGFNAAAPAPIPGVDAAGVPVAFGVTVQSIDPARECP